MFFYTRKLIFIITFSIIMMIGSNCHAFFDFLDSSIRDAKKVILKEDTTTTFGSAVDSCKVLKNIKWISKIEDNCRTYIKISGNINMNYLKEFLVSQSNTDYRYKNARMLKEICRWKLYKNYSLDYFIHPYVFNSEYLPDMLNWIIENHYKYNPTVQITYILSADRHNLIFDNAHIIVNNLKFEIAKRDLVDMLYNNKIIYTAVPAFVIEYNNFCKFKYEKTI